MTKHDDERPLVTKEWSKAFGLNRCPVSHHPCDICQNFSTLGASRYPAECAADSVRPEVPPRELEEPLLVEDALEQELQTSAQMGVVDLLAELDWLGIVVDVPRRKVVGLAEQLLPRLAVLASKRQLQRS